ncbi:MAG: COG2426 family protein [Chloroflexota bacterium]|jgi:uncharacterized membrane protein
MPDPQAFSELLGGLPPQLITFIVAMTPIFELRGAVPLAIFGLGMSPLEAFFWSVLGNAFAGAVVVALLEPVSNFLRVLKPFDMFFNWLFERTRRRHTETFERYQSLALIIFVGIPLPMTGAWTGAAAAFVFGIRLSLAIPLIAVGVILAGIAVTLLSTGVIQVGNLLGF